MSKASIVKLCLVALLLAASAGASDLWDRDLTFAKPELVRIARIGDGMDRAPVEPVAWSAEPDAATTVRVKGRSAPDILTTGEMLYFVAGSNDVKDALTGSAAVAYYLRGIRLEIRIVTGDGWTDSGPFISSDIAALGDVIANMAGKPEWSLPEDVRFVLAHITVGGGYLIGRQTGGLFVGFNVIEIQ